VDIIDFPKNDPVLAEWNPTATVMGHQFDVMVTKEEPIKIVIINLGPERSNVGASLVANPPNEKKEK